MNKLLKITDGLCKTTSVLISASLMVAAAMSLIFELAIPSKIVTVVKIGVPAAVGYLVIWIAIRKVTSEIVSRQSEIALKIAEAAENQVDVDKICEGIAEEAETLLGFANTAAGKDESIDEDASEAKATTPIESSGFGSAIAGLFGMTAPELKKSIKKHVKKHLGTFSQSSLAAIVRKHANIRQRVVGKVMEIDFRQKFEVLSGRFAIARVAGFMLGLLSGILLAAIHEVA